MKMKKTYQSLDRKSEMNGEKMELKIDAEKLWRK